MGNFRIEELTVKNEKDYTRWINFIGKSINDTLFHHPDFLSYHESKYQEHHIAVYKGDSLFAILPMAIDSSSGHLAAKSPYAASFGGFLHLKNLEYSESKNMISEFLNYCRAHHIHEIKLVPQLPYHYDQFYSETFQFALLEAGFKNSNADITSVVPLSPNLETDILTSSARNMAGKAEKNGIVCVMNADITDFWTVLLKTYDKIGVAPTHSKKEWMWLQDKLPDSVCCDVAYLEKKPVAAIGHFKINNRVDSSFYLCSDPEHQNTQALSLLISVVLKSSLKKGFKWFDFGTSTAAMVARENLFRFKESFGAIGFFRRTLVYKFQ